MSDPQEISNRKITPLIVAIGMFALAFLGDITWVTWTVAATSSKVEIAAANWSSLNDFRIETVGGFATQKEINRELIRQLTALAKKDSILEYRINRLDKVHNLQDPVWDNISIPK
jgi:hypothetical protein